MEENQRKDLEQQEMQVLEKILKGAHEIKDETSEINEGIGGIGNVTEPNVYEKIIAKLLEYNEKVNDGKEISVVEYLKRIEMGSDFAKQYDI